MVPFKYLKTLYNTIQWEWLRLLVYLPNLSMQCQA